MGCVLSSLAPPTQSRPCHICRRCCVLLTPYFFSLPCSGALCEYTTVYCVRCRWTWGSVLSGASAVWLRRPSCTSSGACVRVCARRLRASGTGGSRPGHPARCALLPGLTRVPVALHPPLDVVESFKCSLFWRFLNLRFPEDERGC